MNKVIQMGRVVADIDPDKDVHYTTGENPMCIANFRLAVDKKYTKNLKEGEPTADFFRWTAFGKVGEFVKNYLHKGTKIVVTGKVQNDNYTDANGNKVFRDSFIVEEIEFAESKKAAEANGIPTTDKASVDGFVNLPAGAGAEDSLPFR